MVNNFVLTIMKFKFLYDFHVIILYQLWYLYIVYRLLFALCEIDELYMSSVCQIGEL